MLTSVDKNMAATLMPLLDRSPELSVRLAALLRAYGTGRGFFNVWVQNDYKAALFRLEGSFFFLDLGDADFDETAFFLNFNPYFKRLAGEYDTLVKLSQLMPDHLTLSRTNLLRRSPGGGGAGGPAEADGRLSLSRSPDLKAVYSLTAEVLPQEAEYAAWYTDLSHRIRHGCACAYLLCCEGTPVSACLISAESGRAGLISGVCTRPGYRGHGFASAMLTNVCDDLADSGKLPVLECADELIPFYQRFGFQKAGETGELE